MRPADGESVSLSCEVEKPCFTIRNGYWEPVRKCYKVKFPNAIELKKNDEIELTIRVPRTIKGNVYEYTIPDYGATWQGGNFATWQMSVDMDAFISGTEGCQHLTAGSDDDSGSDAHELARLHCGWIEFYAKFTVGVNLGDVCEFEYSLCFDKQRLTSNTKECECDKEKESESILYNCDPCVVLTVP